jgi:hypothetical protein
MVRCERSEPRRARAAPVVPGVPDPFELLSQNEDDCSLCRASFETAATLPPHDEGGLCADATNEVGVVYCRHLKVTKTGTASALMVRCVAQRSLEPRGRLQFVPCVVRDGSLRCLLTMREVVCRCLKITKQACMSSLKLAKNRRYPALMVRCVAQRSLEPRGRLQFAWMEIYANQPLAKIIPLPFNRLSRLRRNSPLSFIPTRAHPLILGTSLLREAWCAPGIRKERRCRAGRLR